MRRQTEGSETWKRLRDWDRGQKASERLSAQILRVEGFKSIDPSHPLGGPDGLKDIICSFDNIKWIGACYFSRNSKSFSDIKTKFIEDAGGVTKNKVDGFVFLTNQELSLSQREELSKSIDTESVQIFHLERLSSILDSPACYGIRLEYLDIEMSKEEQLAFIFARDQLFENYDAKISELLSIIKSDRDKIVPHNAESSVVLPEGDSLLSLATMSIHRCSYCKYGFKVSKLGMAVSPFGRNVTCPKCGNVDEFFN